MSRVRRNHIKRTQYNDQLIPEDQGVQIEDLAAEDEELAARIEARRNLTRRTSSRKKRRTVVLMILIFAVLLTMCSREIVRLKAENLSLRRQHAQLEAERDRLNKELGQVTDKEYIKNQARKQLRLLDPGEKMFIFDDGKTESEEVAEEEKADEKAAESDQEDKQTEDKEKESADAKD